MTRGQHRALTALLPVVLVIGLSSTSELSQAAPSADASSFTGSEPTSTAPINTIQEGKASSFSLPEGVQTRVIVQLVTESAMSVGTTSWQQVVNRRMAITRDQKAVERSLDGTSTTILQRYSSISAMALSTDSAGLRALKQNPLVRSIEPDIPVRVQLDETAPLIQANAVWSAGYTGDGQAVAIIDTGVDRDHPMFADEFGASRVVSEGCYSSAIPAFGEASMCPEGEAAVIGEGAADDCPVAVHGCGHGTHVAGIAAGGEWEAGGTTVRGIAPDADILAFAVFTRVDSPSWGIDWCDGFYPCALSYNSDQLLALQRIEALSTSHNIASVNMSLGGGQYSEACPGGAIAQQIGRLKELGISTVIAAGNDGLTGEISAPACIPDAVAVGATTLNDKVAIYSNTADGLVDLYAPGSGVLSAYPDGSYRSFSGTSMAAPHVAGAFALLREKRPLATPQEMLLSVQTTGVDVATREISDELGFSIPRIAINDAANLLLPVVLEVDAIGDGIGSIVSDPAGIDCGSTCSLSVNTPTTYVLTATPELGSELVGWTGCDEVDGSDCTVTVENDSVAVTAEFAAIPAEHDDFLDAQLIVISDDGSFSEETSTINATIEDDEPSPECANRFGSSVWYEWIAPSNGTLTISSEGSNFDTVVSAYTGISFVDLTSIGCSDDVREGVDTFSLVSLDVTRGALYYLQVGGWESDSGMLSLSAEFDPVLFEPLSKPERLLDTRSGSKVGELDGSGAVRELQVTGAGGVPSSGVSAVALNVTAVSTETNDFGGFVTVFPCGTRPDASNLNFTSGQTIPNSVIAPVSSDGKVCFYVYGKAHLLADVSGYFVSGFEPLTPDRIMDTRSGDKVGELDGSGSAYELQVTGAGGVPASGVSAVALNVTAVSTETNDFGGFVTVFPCGTRPDASNLNFTSGMTIPNSVIAPVSSDGKVCFYVYGKTHLLADVSGYFSSGFESLTPDRIMDTRSGDKVGELDGSGSAYELQVTGAGGVPASGVSAVALNVTAVSTETNDFGGFVTVFPCGTRPDASNLNFTTGMTIPNSVIAPVSDDGKVCFYVYGNAHLLADVSGYMLS